MFYWQKLMRFMIFIPGKVDVDLTTLGVLSTVLRETGKEHSRPPAGWACSFECEHTVGGGGGSSPGGFLRSHSLLPLPLADARGGAGSIQDGFGCVCDFLWGNQFERHPLAAKKTTKVLQLWVVLQRSGPPVAAGTGPPASLLVI